MEESNGSHKLAEMCPVLVWKYSEEDARTKSKYIDEKFPCFVPTRDLLRRVTWWSVKRSRQVRGCRCDLLSVSLPSLSLKNSPIPCLFAIWMVTIESASPETQK